MKKIITACVFLLSFSQVSFSCHKCTTEHLCKHKVAAKLKGEVCGCTKCEKKAKG